VMYYVPMLWCWQLIRILVKTNHPCLRVRHHSWGVINDIRANPHSFTSMYRSVEKDTVACGSGT
jgi:hypothetical protein